MQLSTNYLYNYIELKPYLKLTNYLYNDIVLKPDLISLHYLNNDTLFNINKQYKVFSTDVLFS